MMYQKITIALALIVASVAAGSAQASITINWQAGAFFNADRTAQLEDVTAVLLTTDDLSNVDADDFKFSPDSFAPDGYTELGRVDNNDALTDGGFFGEPQSSFSRTISGIDFVGLGLDQGDPLVTVFYDLPFDENAEGPGAGVNFGMMFSEEIGGLPGDGGVVLRQFLVEPIPNANLDPQAGQARFTTVPEPGTATAMIAALGGLVMMSRRRRSA